MTYTANHSNPNYCECEFTVPIKLNIPVTINSYVQVNAVPVTKQKLPIFIEPDLLLEPEVRANTPVCYPQNGCDYQNLQHENTMQSVEIR